MVVEPKNIMGDSSSKKEESKAEQKERERVRGLNEGYE